MSLSLQDATLDVILPRSGPTTVAPYIAVPAWGDDARARLYGRRYPTDEAFGAVPMTRTRDTLRAALPVQPPALVLGPITQAYAFGAWWTGVPFGWDLTDNKTWIMWIGWAVAGIAAARKARRTRAAVLVAAMVMLAVYMIPHSVRGSQLDYTRLPERTAPVR